MKALNLRQPWAEMIMRGMKTIETRMWKTAYRGPLLIVASKTKPAKVPGYKQLRPERQYILGHAVAKCHLIDCRPMTIMDQGAACFDCEPGRWAWILSNIEVVKPFPVKGQLKLYDVEVPT